MSLTSSITSAIEERRVQRERLDVEIQKLEQMLELSTDLEGTEPPAATPAPVPAVSKSKAAKKPSAKPKPKPATGDRTVVVLDAIRAGHPIGTGTLEEHTGLPRHQLKPILKQLVDDGQVHRTGATTNLRWHLGSAPVTKRQAVPAPAASPPPAKVPVGTGRSKEDVAVVLDAITQSQPITRAVLAEMLRHDDIDLDHALNDLRSKGQVLHTADGLITGAA